MSCLLSGLGSLGSCLSRLLHVAQIHIQPGEVWASVGLGLGRAPLRAVWCHCPGLSPLQTAEQSSASNPCLQGGDREQVLGCQLLCAESEL